MDNSNFRLKDKSYRCYFELAIDLIGGKWKSVILYHLGHHGVLRYADFKRFIPTITERMLTKALRELEGDGLIHREAYPEIPPKVEYSLLPKGESIMPILDALKNWGEGYHSDNIDLFEQKELDLEE